MRQNVICLVLALAYITGVSISSSSAPTSSGEKESLIKLIEDGKKFHLDVLEMAFFLATHDYDATPRDGYVSINLDGEIYKVIP